jgi:hypothetical protein
MEIFVMNQDNSSNAVIETPREAKVISLMSTTRGTNAASVKVAVVTPEQGLLATDIKPLLDHYYTTLHWQPSFMLVAPLTAFAQGYVLLDGTKLRKADFPSWAKTVQGGLAIEIDDEEFQLKDFTHLYLRPKLSGAGTVQDESLPNITGSGIYSFRRPGGNRGAYSLRQDGVGNHGKLGSTGSAGETGESHITFNASYSSSTYGRRNEVAPTSLLTHVYAFLGEYVGEPIEHVTYYLLAPDQSWTGQTLMLPNAIGHNPSYMTCVAPPQMVQTMSQKRTANPAKYFWVKDHWVLATPKSEASIAE